MSNLALLFKIKFPGLIPDENTKSTEQYGGFKNINGHIDKQYLEGNQMEIMLKLTFCFALWFVICLSSLVDESWRAGGRDERRFIKNFFIIPNTKESLTKQNCQFTI